MAVALAWFALGLIGHAALELVARAFYALKDSARPAMLSALSMVLNVILSVLFSRLFAAWGWLPFGGLALALSLSTLIEVIVLFVLLERRAPEISLRPTMIALGKSLLATVIMGAAIYGWQRIVGEGEIATVLAMVIGGAVYFAAAYLLRSEEAHWVMDFARRRMKGRR